MSETRTENYGSAIRPEDRPATPENLGATFGTVKGSPTIAPKDAAIPVGHNPFESVRTTEEKN
jgi:hypothetical protein